MTIPTFPDKILENARFLVFSYTSKLSKKIEEGKNGIQYLDYKIFVEILKETEPELFKQ